MRLSAGLVLPPCCPPRRRRQRKPHPRLLLDAGSQAGALVRAAVRRGHGGGVGAPQHYDPDHVNDPVVAYGTVQKADVIAYLAERNESEIVALPESVTIEWIERING